jgi:phenylacetic acid degradation operon negative regulatory protein
MTTGTDAPAASAHVGPRAVVEHCLAADGSAPVADVLDAARVLGIEDQPVRLAVRRMAAAGLLVQQGRGRAGTLVLTPEARLRSALDDEYWAFARRQDRGQEVWDGRWRLLAFSVPESRRADRDALRAALAHLGAATLTPGLYVSPHDLTDALAAELPDRDPGADLTVAVADAVRHRGQDLRAVVPELWALDGLRAGYRRLDAVVEAWLARVAAEPGATVRRAARVAVGAAVDLAVGPDPLLPPVLLPADWPGGAVRGRTERAWQVLGGAAPMSHD